MCLSIPWPLEFQVHIYTHTHFLGCLLFESCCFHLEHGCFVVFYGTRALLSTTHAVLVAVLRSRGDKHSALVESLNMHGRAMVFCNGVPSCRSTEHVLREAGFDSVGLHGGIPPKLRSKFYQSFLDGSASVLVCTDIAARGLDFGGEVDTVVNFDTPLDATTYLHRAGRAGRAGARGIVTTLYAKREAARANELRTAVQSGSELVSIDHTLHRAGDVLKNTLKRSSSPKHTKMKLANDPAVPKHVAKVVHR